VVVVLVDGNIGQIMEPAELPPMRPVRTEYPDWAVRGAEGRERRILSSIYIDPRDEEVMNYRLAQHWQQIVANEIRYKTYHLEDARYAVIGFGTAGRVALSAVRTARQEGMPVGLFRPVSLNPFPYDHISALQSRWTPSWWLR